MAATVLLPAYNEAEALPVVLSALTRVLAPNTEVLIVDDGSTDGTAAVAREFSCRVIEHQQNLGKGAAMRTGFRAARGDVIVVLDADNTYPAEEVPKLIERAAYHDLVRGVRTEGLANMPSLNRLGNRAFDRTLELLHGLEGSDYLTGLYALRRRALDSMDLVSDGFDIEVEICIKARALDLSTSTIPIQYHERIGEKKLNAWKDGCRILRRALRLAFRYRPGRIFFAPGLLLLGLTGILVLLLGQQQATPTTSPVDVTQVTTGALGFLAVVQLGVFGISAALRDSAGWIRPNRFIEAVTNSRVWALISAFSATTLAAGAGLGILSGTALIAASQWKLASLASIEMFGLAVFLSMVGTQGLLASMYATNVAEGQVQTPLSGDTANVPLQGQS